MACDIVVSVDWIYSCVTTNRGVFLEHVFGMDLRKQSEQPETIVRILKQPTFDQATGVLYACHFEHKLDMGGLSIAVIVDRELLLCLDIIRYPHRIDDHKWWLDDSWYLMMYNHHLWSSNHHLYHKWFVQFQALLKWYRCDGRLTGAWGRARGGDGPEAGWLFCGSRWYPQTWLAAKSPN